MRTPFPQLAGLFELACDSVKAVAAVVWETFDPPPMRIWIVREKRYEPGYWAEYGYTHDELHSQLAQTWERLSTQAPSS